MNLTEDNQEVKFVLILTDPRTNTHLARLEAPSSDLLMEKLGSLERYLQKQNLTLHQWSNTLSD